MLNLPFVSIKYDNYGDAGTYNEHRKIRLQGTPKMLCTMNLLFYHDLEICKIQNLSLISYFCYYHWSTCTWGKPYSLQYTESRKRKMRGKHILEV